MESEDWLRCYPKMDHVDWSQEDDRLLVEVAQSLANDIGNNNLNRVILGMGPLKETDGIVLDDLLQRVFVSIQGTHHRITLSVLEIVHDDQIRDLLNPESKLRIRFFDNKGATVQNLTELEVNTLKDIQVSLCYGTLPLSITLLLTTNLCTLLDGIPKGPQTKFQGAFGPCYQHSQSLEERKRARQTRVCGPGIRRGLVSVHATSIGIHPQITVCPTWNSTRAHRP